MNGMAKNTVYSPLSCNWSYSTLCAAAEHGNDDVLRYLLTEFKMKIVSYYDIVPAN